jgi:hypothetical protein
MDEFFEALRVLRVPGLVALLAVCMLVLPDQVRDLYRALAENLYKPEARTDAFVQIGITGITLLLAAFLTYYVGRHRAAVHLASSPNPGQVLSSTLRWGPPICGTLLLAGTALGMLLAVRDVSGIAGHVGSDFERIVEEMRVAARYLTVAATGVAALAVLFLAATYAWDRWRGLPRSPSRRAFGPVSQVLCYAVAAGLVATAFSPKVSVPLSQQAGSLAIFFVFLAVLLVALSLLQSASARHGIPYILLLVVWTLAWTALDAGNMHRIPLVDRPKTVPAVSEIGPRFLEWLAARKDRDAFEGQPYPVYLVAAEAGGLYAAQFTAKILARIQDQCPSFAQHVFAISGVSGGSLGAAMFAALAKSRAANAPWQSCKLDLAAEPTPGPLEKKIDALLDGDFLAPIVTRALFGDFVQHVVPVSLVSGLPGLTGLAQLSRGRALEESIEDAWAKKTEGGARNPFVSPFLEHWDPTDAGPALLINTTSVEDGRLIVIAPFRAAVQETGSDIAYLHANSLPETKDITLSAAVGLSGRFPWVLPPAKVPGSGLALVDGAYFEASGLETLRAVRFALRPFELNGLIKVHMIVIGSQQPEGSSTSGLLDEATPPVRAMLNVRLRRGYSVRNAFLDENYRQALQDCPGGGLQSLNISDEAAPSSPDSPQVNQVRTVPCSARPEPQFSLEYERFNLPLGWKLSHVMQSIVERHSRGRCLPEDLSSLPKESDASSVSELFVKNKRSEFLVAYSLTPIAQERSARLLEEFTSKCR